MLLPLPLFPRSEGGLINSQQGGRRGNGAVGSIDLGFIWSTVLTLGELLGRAKHGSNRSLQTCR